MWPQENSVGLDEVTTTFRFGGGVAEKNCANRPEKQAKTMSLNVAFCPYLRKMRSRSFASMCSRTPVGWPLSSTYRLPVFGSIAGPSWTFGSGSVGTGWPVFGSLIGAPG